MRDKVRSPGMGRGQDARATAGQRPALQGHAVMMDADLQSNPSEDCRSAGVPPAVPGASRSGEVAVRSRGRLPHIERQGAVYFVTFRLADSLTAAAVRRLRDERRRLAELARQDGRVLRPEEAWHIDRAYRRQVEAALDRAQGNCWLRRPTVAQMVVTALQRFAQQRYILGPWCVMPNHVHVLVRPIRHHSLAHILHSWKSFTAKAANRMLGRSGTFWQREYYDHIVRNQKELRRCADYIASNPVRAGLADWPWMREGDLEGLVAG